MRDKERMDRITTLLFRLWKKYPDQRLGQLLLNYVFLEDRQKAYMIWAQEDNSTEARLRELE